MDGMCFRMIKKWWSEEPEKWKFGNFILFQFQEIFRENALTCITFFLLSCIGAVLKTTYVMALQEF